MDKLLPAQVDKTDRGLQVSRSYSELLEEGDLITHIGNRRITSKSAETISRYVTTNERDSITVVVERKGESIRIPGVKLVRADEWKEQVDAAVAREKKKEFDRRVRNSAEQRQRWLDSTTFFYKGREWTSRDIDEHNRPIIASLLKARAESSDSVLGLKLDVAYNVVTVLQLLEGLPEGGEVVLGTYDYPKAYRSTRSYLLQHKNNTAFAPSIRDAFRLTDAGLILVPCRDSTLRTMEDVWERAWLKIVE